MSVIFKALFEKLYGAPAGIRTRVFGSKGRNDWPDYTTGAHRISQRDQQYTWQYINLSLLRNLLVQSAS